jgi:N6-adenosine-specific RNA methylase IME4
MYQKRPGSKGGGVDGGLGYAENHYPTMTNEELLDLPVRAVAAKDAHLFMWFTNPGAFGGRFSQVTPAQIAAAWGFEFKTILTWVKTTREGAVSRGGMGWYFRGCTEHILYATRGRAGITTALREPNVLMAPKSRHSAKPAEFMELIERVIPDASRIELFCRTPRPGWTAWGNQVGLDPFSGGAPQPEGTLL